MFGLTLVDHLPDDVRHVIYTHRVHTQLASRYARWHRWSLGAEALLILTAALSSIVLVSTMNGTLAMVPAVTASAAACVLAVRLMLDLEAGQCASHLRGEVVAHPRAVSRRARRPPGRPPETLDAARAERDLLMARLQAVYDLAPPATASSTRRRDSASPNMHEDAILDQEVDRFLPASLQKGGQSGGLKGRVL